MKTFRLFSALLLTASNCMAQSDTLRVCTYNLLNYGNSANTYSVKNQRLQPILQQIKPSLQCFNEVSTAVPGLLDTLSSVMPYATQHGQVHNTTSTTQLYGLFWRQGKFHLLHDSIICSDVRDIVAYELYWEYPDLGIYHDTLKLTVITAHLKSSNASSDRAERARETQKVSVYLSALNGSSNIIMLGDFNLYTSSEVAYQNLTNPASTRARLNDPLNRPGTWDNNSSFADIHTQSPRLAALSDGGASGGLDSRFDFILVSDAVMNGSLGMKYLPGSYKSFGNDGQHYGKALMDLPANTSVSASTAQALYECSDHLPVFADVIFTPLHLIPLVGITAAHAELQSSISVLNPFANCIYLSTSLATPTTLSYQVRSMDGKVLKNGSVVTPHARIDLRQDLAPGVYFLQILDTRGATANYKLIHY